MTGGAGGVGRAVALQLALQGGYSIVTYAPGDEAGARVAHELREMGTLAHAVEADVARSEDVRRVFSVVADLYGRLDLLVNAAGARRDAALADLTEEDWDVVLDASLKGAFLCAQAAARLMVKRPSPAMVNVASEAGMTGGGAGANYVAAHAGLIGLTKILARELAPRIRVNCVAAANVEIGDVMERHAAQGGGAHDAAAGGAPASFSPSLAPDEVARACIYLLSSDAGAITGQTLVVTGRHWKDEDRGQGERLKPDDVSHFPHDPFPFRPTVL